MESGSLAFPSAARASSWGHSPVSHLHKNPSTGSDSGEPDLRPAIGGPLQRRWGKNRLASEQNCTLLTWLRLLPAHSVCKRNQAPGPTLNPPEPVALIPAGRICILLALLTSPLLVSPRKCADPLQGPEIFFWKAVNPKINWSPCHQIIRMGPQER